MRIVICPDAETATARVVDAICAQVRARPACVLGLATGGTMEGVYRGMITAHAAGLTFARARTFNLDEYVGLGPDHPQSYAAYMCGHLFDHIDLPPGARHLPDGLGDPGISAARYEAAIVRHGPIDLQLLGLGHNGHIGFNEPGSSLVSRARETVLAQATLDANARFFGAGEALPQSAVTMGVGTITDARAVVLLALGAAKSVAVRAMIEGAVSAFCPASALQMHADVTVVLDEGSAGALALSDHYRHAEAFRVRRDGR